MKSPIAFDITHLVSRLDQKATSGIDKVDLAFARYLSVAAAGPAVIYGQSAPHVIEHRLIGELVKFASEAPWEAQDLFEDHAYHDVLAKLSHTPHLSVACASPPRRYTTAEQIRRFAFKYHVKRRRDFKEVPHGAIYLNVAQHRLEQPEHFSWLSKRPDVCAVFFIHDLLPLDIPEFFRPSEQVLFERRIGTAIHYGKAFITTTEAVKARLAREIAERGYAPTPIHVAPLPSMLTCPRQIARVATPDPDLKARRYFVVLGTVEPRKNHMLLLNIWRSLVETMSNVPTLVVLGSRGWGTAQVLDIIDRSKSLRPHIVEAAGLSLPAVVQILGNATALLMPSFDEGYGLPLVEALTLGTPVVVNDKPVFREVSQGCATYIDTIDGMAWREEITELAAMSTKHREACARASKFKPPSWGDYFKNLEAFIAQNTRT